VWGALRGSLLDGHLHPDDYVAVLEAAMPAELDEVVELILNKVGAVWLGTYFVKPADRSRLTALAGRIVASAGPGGNRQLVASRILVELTDDAGMLREWREGGTPEGLRVDDDFRWRLLRSLCAHGAADQDDIAAERQRDPSSQGLLHALRCKSSIPDAEVKAEVWSSLVEDHSLSNYEAYALAGRFFSARNAELTRPYADRYFTEFAEAAGARGGMMAEQLALEAFPRYHVGEDVIANGEAALKRDLDPGVRRRISDALDDMRRLLAARERLSG
jgi:aminopeptidase N